MPRKTADRNGYGLIADIGGTHVRFAVTRLTRPAPVPSSIRALATRDHSDIGGRPRVFGRTTSVAAAAGSGLRGCRAGHAQRSPAHQRRLAHFGGPPEEGTEG